MEGAGEDPWYGSQVAVARVKGFQGESWKDLKKINTVLACAKHFAAYGASEPAGITIQWMCLSSSL